MKSNCQARPSAIDETILIVMTRLQILVRKGCFVSLSILLVARGLGHPISSCHILSSCLLHFYTRVFGWDKTMHYIFTNLIYIAVTRQISIAT